MKKTTEPILNPVWEEEIKKVLDKLWENRANLSSRNMDLLRKFADKKF
jgi:hypothetical protein